MIPPLLANNTPSENGELCSIGRLYGEAKKEDREGR